MSDPSERQAATKEEEPFLRVECYAGHRAETEPRRLHLGQREVAVTQIIDRWLDPRHRYFKLRAPGAPCQPLPGARGNSEQGPRLRTLLLLGRTT